MALKTHIGSLRFRNRLSYFYSSEGRRNPKHLTSTLGYMSTAKMLERYRSGLPTDARVRKDIKDLFPSDVPLPIFEDIIQQRENFGTLEIGEAVP